MAENNWAGIFAIPLIDQLIKTAFDILCFMNQSAEGQGEDKGTCKIFLRSSRIRVDLQSYESKPTDKQEQYDRRAEDVITGLEFLVEPPYVIPRGSTGLRRKVKTKVKI